MLLHPSPTLLILKQLQEIRVLSLVQNEPEQEQASDSCVDQQEMWKTYDPSGTFSNITCEQIAEKPSVWCVFFAPYKLEGVGTYEACCACHDESQDHVSYQPSQAPSDGPSLAPSLAPSSQCVDDPTYIWDESIGLGCEYMSSNFCELFSAVWHEGKNTYSACCACGGGYGSTQQPSVAPSSSSSEEFSIIESAAGEGHTCAIVQNYGTSTNHGEGNVVLCWERNHHGQLGQGTTSAEDEGIYEPIGVVDLGDNGDAMQIALGAGYTCVVTNTGAQLLCGARMDMVKSEMERLQILILPKSLI